MEAFMHEVSQKWRDGGVGCMEVMRVARALQHCRLALIDQLLAKCPDPAETQRWVFFISDSDECHCIELSSQHQVVELMVLARLDGSPLLTAPGDFVARSRRLGLVLMTEQELEQEQQEMTSMGNRAAGNILNDHSKYYASHPLATIQVHGLGKAIHFHMWRKEVLERLQAQLELPDAASVPFRVWRRMRRTSFASMLEEVPVLSSMVVAGGLVCWECGAMPASLKQCGRCGVAWFCSKQCQRAQHSSHKRWCSGIADEVRLRPSNTPAVQSCITDMDAAVCRSPAAMQLVCNSDTSIASLCAAVLPAEARRTFAVDFTRETQAALERAFLGMRVLVQSAEEVVPDRRVAVINLATAHFERLTELLQQGAFTELLQQRAMQQG